MWRRNFLLSMYPKYQYCVQKFPIPNQLDPLYAIFLISFTSYLPISAQVSKTSSFPVDWANFCAQFSSHQYFLHVRSFSSFFFIKLRIFYFVIYFIFPLLSLSLDKISSVLPLTDELQSPPQTSAV